MKKWMWFIIVPVALFMFLLVIGMIYQASLTPEQRQKLEQNRKTSDSLSAIQQHIDDSLNIVKNKAKDDSDYEENSKYDVFIVAEKYVTERLKSPKSAEFVSGTQKYLRDDSTWVVFGKVDAVNSFNATIRSDYQVKLQHKSDNKFYLLDISIK